MLLSGSVGNEAVFRIAFGCLEAWVIDVERRAIGAKDLPVLSHVEIDVRVVERRAGAHAIEFLDADENALGADVICEMRDNGSGHATPFANW